MDYLKEIRNLLKGFDADIDQLTEELAYIRGTLDEMKRHNGKVIKVLAGIIAVLVPAFVAIVSYVVSK